MLRSHALFGSLKGLKAQFNFQSILLIIALCFMSNFSSLSAQTDLSSDILKVQSSDVSIDVLQTALTKYTANPQGFTLPFVYNDMIIDAIVDNDVFQDLQRQEPYIREYFTTPDDVERLFYEGALLQSIEEIKQ